MADSDGDSRLPIESLQLICIPSAQESRFEGANSERLSVATFDKQSWSSIK